MITRRAPVAPVKRLASNHIRRLAKEVQRTFPDMDVHQHLTDAARENDAGRTDNAKRHLDAAVAAFAPLQLIRHGIHDDEGHRAAKNFMQQAHRGRLLVQDAEHISGENAGLMERRRDQAVASQQQRAMRNAQPQPVGRTDRAVAAPDAPERPGSKQIAASWDAVSDAIELATFAGARPGSGKNFAKLKGSLARRGVRDPGALAAYIGRKKYGRKGFAKLSTRGRSHSHANPAGRTGDDADAPDAPEKAGSKQFTLPSGKVVELVTARGGEVNLVGPKGYVHGWKYVGGPGLPPAMHTATFSYEGRPGDMGHLRAMEAASHAIRPVSDTAANALHNAVQAVAERRMTDARTHLAVAAYETRGTGSAAIIKAIRDSLDKVPAGTYARLPYRSGMAPASIGPRQPGIRHGPGYYPSPSAVVGASWEDVPDAVELSAQTGRLASQPHPFGKPGGPGLWDVKGMELPPYIQNIARALLRTGRAKTLSQAIAIAKGATNRWAHGGGHVHPEVRAAAAKTNADWDAKRAVARSHANNPYLRIELTGTAAGAAKDQRIAAGQAGGGRFGTGGGATAGKGGQARPQQTRAQRKAALLAQAKKDRAAARLLLIRIRADRAALASASGKVSKGQKGSTTTARGSTTKASGAPAAKGAAKTASPTSNAATGLTPQQVKKATAQATAQAKSMSKQQLLSAIKALSAQEQALLKQAAADVAQASKL